MECKKYADRLTAYIDGELKDKDCRKIRAHLDACASCADEYLSIKKTSDFIETHCGCLDPRPEIWFQIRYRAVSADPVLNERLPLVNRWSLSFIAAAILVLFVVGMLQFQSVQQRDLNQYISQYIIEREKLNNSMILVETRTGAQTENEGKAVFIRNPFLETSSVFPENPFR